MDRTFVMSREAGLDRLARFLAGPGIDYPMARNTDRGPGRHPSTSVISPYLRRRLLTEVEVVSGAVGEFGEDGAAKFVSEVFWRTYFKGHLETHPEAWSGYLADLDGQRLRLPSEPGLRRMYDDAVAGRTGIEGFDDWAVELVETGWLHNHARMWFASIWIFTLRLPWTLGADFFLRHLLDGDPASNTLSWRWVAGLHTRGKHYVARSENIRRYTDGRFDPKGLDEHPDPLDEPMPPREVRIPRAGEPPAGDVALLLHLDDLHPESLPLGPAKVVRVGGLTVHGAGASAMVKAADEAAMADGLARAASLFGCEARPANSDWAGDLPVVTAWAPVGPSADALPDDCIRVRRGWDERAWPLSTRGFFKLRSAIGRLSATEMAD